MSELRLTKFGRELRSKADELFLVEHEWTISGSGHLQPRRLRPDGTSTPIHNKLGQPIVASLTPGDQRGAMANFLKDLADAGVARRPATNKAKNRKRQAPTQAEMYRRRREDHHWRQVMDIVESAPIDMLEEFAAKVVRSQLAAAA